jgi:hypothetical protein
MSHIRNCTFRTSRARETMSVYGPWSGYHLVPREEHPTKRPPELPAACRENVFANGNVPLPRYCFEA